MTPNTETTWHAADGAELHAYGYGDVSAPPERRVVIVCGAFLPALVYAPFATALVRRLEEEHDSSWAVWVYDRRGKGKSSPVDESYTLDTETGDVRLALRETGARHLFGHSLGGSITLHAVRELSAATDPKLRALTPDSTSVYDPAINLDGSIDTSWLADFRESVDAGHFGRALAQVERHLGMSRTLSHAPNWMLTGALALAVRTGFRGAGKAVFPAGVAELTAALGEEARAADFSGLNTRLCVMTGERSADYFQATTVALAHSVPEAELFVAQKGIHGSIPAVRHNIVDALALWLEAEPFGALNLGAAALPPEVRGT